MKLIQDYISEKIKLYKKKIMLSIYPYTKREDNYVMRVQVSPKRNDKSAS